MQVVAELGGKNAVIVVGSQNESLLSRTVEATASLVLADPTDPVCDMGPVINAAAAQRIRKMIAQGGQGAKLAYRGDLEVLPIGH